MSIEKSFKRLKKEGNGALISYIMGGDPQPDLTPRIAGALVEGGTDILELGIPFSDPIADGPTIQEANQRALSSGTTPLKVLELATHIKDDHDIPLIILTYYNPIFRIGVKKFFDMAKKSKVDGVIVPDLPVEEAQDYKLIADTYGLDTIFLASPSTTIDRLEKIIRYTSGFLYLVSIFGVTGAREKLQQSTIYIIKKLLPYTAGKVPLAVGFGISQPYHIKSIIEAGADGAIVGSAFVEMIKRSRYDVNTILNRIRRYTSELKRATILNRK
ncbi:MAG: tryptophan synthase subunit alpha [Candidatus Methylarchaceae archaeon HK01B]|nr:tryptophan synthase subunit alpha [Candidatus Methylarchaceae archaeon HK01B]